MQQPTVIVGAGLAGLSTAMALEEGPILLADVNLETAASQVAVAGLANPIMAQRGNLVWRAEAALAALDRLASRVGCGPTHRGLLRPANSWKQMEAFRARAASNPALAQWHDKGTSRERWPWLQASMGVLEVLRGGSFDIPQLLSAATDYLRAKGASVRMGWRLTSWQERGDSVEAMFEGPDGTHAVPCGRLLLCLGAGATEIPQLQALNLHRVKGQLVQVSVPSSPTGVRPVSGAGYVIPDDRLFTVGSSFEHTYDTTAPVRRVSETLIGKASRFLPWLADATIQTEMAGIRLTVPETRMPMVGPVPGHRRTWVFVGLGSKGLLTAPLVADSLPDWLRSPADIPPELDVRRR